MGKLMYNIGLTLFSRIEYLFTDSANTKTIIPSVSLPSEKYSTIHLHFGE